jgi:orotate phosphoribosyltransferase
LDLETIYKDAGAYLEGHFLLSSGNHSQFYLQSAKVLEDPKLAEKLATALAEQIKEFKVEVDTVCAPALGGVLAGYELARALGVRSIFTERVDKKMTLRRGFEVQPNERVLICEDIITTGGSALEAAKCIEDNGGKVVAFAALANRGFCKRVGGNNEPSLTCKLPNNVPFFALGDFTFEIYNPKECPLCKDGSKAIKPGSRGN